MKQDPVLAHGKYPVQISWTDGSRHTSSISGFYGARQEMTHSQVFQIRRLSFRPLGS